VDDGAGRRDLAAALCYQYAMTGVSERVAAQYERYIYPPPLDDLSGAAARAKTERADPKYFSAHLWPEGRPRNNLRILSAGCGTSQAAHLAYNNPDCTVTGIDLSEGSLAHQRRLVERHGLKNIRLERRDILEIGRSDERFDLIVCTGVLHHMERPEDGLRALASALSPRGALYAMVYATARRAGVYVLQDLFRRLGVAQDESGIAFVRQVLKELPAHHYARWFLPEPGVQIEDAELVDIFLHVQDRAYSVQQVLDLVSGAGLAFQGWSDNGLYTRDAQIDPTTALWSRLDGASEQDEWSVVDDYTLHNMRHSFVARRPSENPSWRIGFDGADWLRYRPVRHPSLTALGGGQFQRGQSRFNLTSQEQLLMQACDGETSIAAILGKISQPSALAERRELAQGFFRRMWRLGHLFYRTA
jgi:2-polyprenyl-3-methyl-5-hydroxy-6-metoxy-1,4-benzoquinol methylase